MGNIKTGTGGVHKTGTDGVHKTGTGGVHKTGTGGADCDIRVRLRAAYKLVK